MSRGPGRQMIDRAGQRYGTFVAIRPTAQRAGASVFWICRCDCGVERELPPWSVRPGSRPACTACGVRARRLPKVVVEEQSIQLSPGVDARGYRRGTEPLTPAARGRLRQLREHVAACGRFPTVNELALMWACSRPRAITFLNHLKRFGWLGPRNEVRA